MPFVNLPYYADPKDLPCPLPTQDEIENSRDVLSGQETRMVVGIGPHFVAKYGINIDPIEGENLLFVQQQQQQQAFIPAPRLYAIYTDASSGKTYIIMERIAGASLLSLWPSLSGTQKSTIARKLWS